MARVGVLSACQAVQPTGPSHPYYPAPGTDPTGGNWDTLIRPT